MNKDWDEFNKRLDKEKFYSACKFQNELAANGVPENEIKLSFIFGNKDIAKGNIVKDEIKIIVNATIITFPKSITGLISENNNEPKATIVVKAVYRHG